MAKHVDVYRPADLRPFVRYRAILQTVAAVTSLGLVIIPRPAHRAPLTAADVRLNAEAYPERDVAP